MFAADSNSLAETHPTDKNRSSFFPISQFPAKTIFPVKGVEASPFFPANTIFNVAAMMGK
jgi:hypothetical protein